MSEQTGSGLGGALDTGSTELKVLLADYQALRDDERTLTNSQAVLGSVFVALLAGLFAIPVGDCRFRNLAPGVSPAQANCYELDVPVYIVAPMMPFAVLGYIVMLGMLHQKITSDAQRDPEELLVGTFECGVPVEGDDVLDQPGVHEPGEGIVGRRRITITVETNEGFLEDRRGRQCPVWTRADDLVWSASVGQRRWQWTGRIEHE